MSLLSPPAMAASPPPAQATLSILLTPSSLVPCPFSAGWRRRCGCTSLWRQRWARPWPRHSAARRRHAKATQLPADSVHVLAARAVHEGRHMRFPAPVRPGSHACVPLAAQVWRVQGARCAARAPLMLLVVPATVHAPAFCSGLEPLPSGRFPAQLQSSSLHCGPLFVRLLKRLCPSVSPPCPPSDCPYKHSLEAIKECNMYKLGFCIYGPAVSVA